MFFLRTTANVPKINSISREATATRGSSNFLNKSIQTQNFCKLRAAVLFLLGAIAIVLTVDSGRVSRPRRTSSVKTKSAGVQQLNSEKLRIEAFWCWKDGRTPFAVLNVNCVGRFAFQLCAQSPRCPMSLRHMLYGLYCVL